MIVSHYGVVQMFHIVPIEVHGGRQAVGDPARTYASEAHDGYADASDSGVTWDEAREPPGPERILGWLATVREELADMAAEDGVVINGADDGPENPSPST